MTALWAFLSATGLVKWLAGAAALVLGYVGIVFRAKRAQRRADEAERIVAETKARAKGDAAVADSKATGKTWQDRLKDHKR